jgi:hypothetical protein
MSDQPEQVDGFLDEFDGPFFFLETLALHRRRGVSTTDGHGWTRM